MSRYTATHYDDAITKQGIQQKRNRYQEQWVEHERGREMAVKDLVHGSSRAATRTSQTSESAKQTGREEPGLSWFKRVQVDRSGQKQRPDYDDGRAPIHVAWTTGLSVRPSPEKDELLKPTLLTLNICPYKLFI